MKKYIRNNKTDIEKRKKKKKKTKKKKVNVEPVTSLDKCRVTFYWVIKCTI